jgi:predicted nuclease with TOPRIM domain
MPMRLIDNLKDFSLDLADYVKAKDQEIEQLKAEIEKRKQVALALQDKLFVFEHENTSLHEALKLIETTHGVDLNTNMCELAEMFRVVLFDVVSEYNKLEKANGDDTRAKD